jgi:hypothetical protein
MNNRKNGITGGIIFAVIVVLIIYNIVKPTISDVIDKVFTNEKYFRLISSNANSFFEDELMEFAKKRKHRFKN